MLRSGIKPQIGLWPAQYIKLLKMTPNLTVSKIPFLTKRNHNFLEE